MVDGKYGALEGFEVRVVAKNGSSFGEAARDAICLAVTEWCNVTLLFNGREYRVIVNDLLAAVLGPDDADDRACAQLVTGTVRGSTTGDGNLGY